MSSDISAAIWGRPAWQTIHAIALGYDLRHGHLAASEDRRAALAFMNALPFLLPCSSCRVGLTELMGREDVRASLESAVSSGDLFAWTVRLHDMVNAKLGRPGVSSVAQARAELLRGGDSSAQGQGQAQAPPPLPWAAACVGGLVVVGLGVGFGLMVRGGYKWSRPRN